MRDRVLDNAEVSAGDTVLDVGCGDGLIAFAALDRVAATGRVVFSDVSDELLDTCREIAGDDARCAFVRAGAEDLSAIDDESVDVVTLRSVLIYVAERERAFAEFFRVLRPGGRLSLFEPLNSFAYPGPNDRWGPWDVRPVQELADRVKGVYRAIHDEAGNTMHDFDALDFVALAERAGFGELRAEAEYTIGPPQHVLAWETVEGGAPNPLVPSLREAADSVLSPEDSARFRTHLREEHEAGRLLERDAVLYLRARKTPVLPSL